jgi:hypothetical protein
VWSDKGRWGERGVPRERRFGRVGECRVEGAHRYGKMRLSLISILSIIRV